MSGAILEARGISKKFSIGTGERLTLFTSLKNKFTGAGLRDFWALKDINFKVNRGEMVAVFGHNGAGKTTLFRILSGILKATSGTYTAKEQISCMFELGLGFNLRQTALENVYLYGALHGISRRVIDKKLPDIVDFAELNNFMGAKLGEFSSGMRARLAFATIMQTLKGIVMVDEVLSVGDVSFQKKCTDAFEKVLNDGHTVLFISHGLGHAKRLCTKGLLIEHGAQVAFGNINEVDDMYTEKMKNFSRG
jgi:ABC-type polysaccharide/polyol phosphate transport system ATPase subunit